MIRPNRWNLRDRYPHTVYLLSDASGDLLYVGCTMDVHRRIRQHRRTKAWGDSIASVRTVELPNLFLALAVEARAIISLRPRHNIERVSYFGSLSEPSTPPMARHVVVSDWYARSVAVGQLDTRTVASQAQHAGLAMTAEAAS